ncbi:D-amino acid dehydrogenase [Marinobacteraceae bacterium S3BR75-40.1]
MHIVVLGAGVVGVTTAWYLRQSGHEVTVLERNDGPAQETSYANGGQVSVSHAEPWANPAAPLKMLKWLMQEDAPLLFRLRMDPAQWIWGLRFLMECTAARTRHNIVQMVNLGTYSRSALQELRRQTGLEYDQREQGILHFYTNPKEFEGALEPARIMREYGCDRQVIDADEAIRIEPALRHIRDRLAGATFTPQDESGDARKFTVNLARKAAEAGVKFEYNTTVVGLDKSSGRIAGVRTIKEGQHGIIQGDSYVLSLGSYSPFLSRPLGIPLHIYPAKGYSITVPVDRQEDAFEVSLTDDEYKLVYSRLGDRLRVAGTAELNGYGRELNLHRCRAIVRRASDVLHSGGHWDQAEFWTGLRPATPSNVPYIGRTRYDNLYLNTGHGTLGWTHGCGSARALADIVNGRVPELDFDFTGISRPTQVAGPHQA